MSNVVCTGSAFFLCGRRSVIVGAFTHMLSEVVVHDASVSSSTGLAEAHDNLVPEPVARVSHEFVSTGTVSVTSVHVCKDPSGNPRHLMGQHGGCNQADDPWWRPASWHEGRLDFPDGALYSVEPWVPVLFDAFKETGPHADRRAEAASMALPPFAGCDAQGAEAASGASSSSAGRLLQRRTA